MQAHQAPDEKNMHIRVIGFCFVYHEQMGIIEIPLKINALKGADAAYSGGSIFFCAIFFTVEDL